ncbi:sulfate transporter family-domain-containing protein [Peziza echinospora]|nr:sulfate transporter family-domain-containing protein [Peziza echinospora]
MSYSGEFRPSTWRDTIHHFQQEDNGAQTRPQPFRAYNSDTLQRAPQSRRASWAEPVMGRHTPPSSPLLSSVKNPARSFFHSSHHAVAPRVHQDGIHQPSQMIRDRTAELANYALSEAANSYQSRFSPSIYGSSIGHGGNSDVPPLNLASSLARPDSPDFGPITEESEPSSPDTLPRPFASRASHLTHLLRTSPPLITTDIVEDIGSVPHDDGRPVLGERTSLLHKSHQKQPINEGYNTITRYNDDAEAESQIEEHNIYAMAHKLFQKRLSWTRRDVWDNVIVKPVGYVPAVILGLLLNVLDGLSYGMILFPLGQAIFSDLGADGLSMFYVSCIISQLVYSCGGSVFKGGVGSEMIEVVPFFHKMAFTILAKVGEDNPKAVLATTILAFSMSSVITGAVFFLLGYLKLGSLTSFFPRHILLGCIGGVGWFLVATGIEVSARLDGNLSYNFETLQHLLQPATLILWTIPLSLAVSLMTLKHFFHHQFLDAAFFISVLTVFYIVVAVVPQLTFAGLREAGWVFELPPDGVPFYHFYTLYDLKETNWEALLSTVPAMFALTFFGILHVPINVPALGVSTGEDNLDVNRELIAHGVSNALSGFCGSIQNYLVYTNSVLFIRSGGDSRLAGIMLAMATAGVWMIGPGIIGYIPIMVVGSLIFYLGIELLKEALYDTWGKVQRLEYFTIIAIVVTMGAWDFVIGILIGIVLACVSYVVQTAQKSAVRGTYTGVVARSTVRRHPIQQRFLQQVGGQIYVTKLTGYMFFGTITSVEKSIRDVLEDYNFKCRPIRYLIIDLSHVNGIDFSAAEAFTRMRRQCLTRNVELVLCGVESESDVGKSLRGVGVWSDTEDGVEIFENLNGALEACENELLATFYRQRETMNQQQQPHGHASLEVPNTNRPSTILDATVNSPRRNLINQAAAFTLKEHVAAPARWQHFKQPLPLILQTFQEMTEKNEDFWFKACGYFKKRQYPAGAVIFTRGAKPDGFYLLEDGMFRADYDLEQGQFSESIVAGTTCGELPFFSDTPRSATVVAEKASTAWVLDEVEWKKLQEAHPEVGFELMKVCLKLTSERLSAITSYILTTAG